MNKQLILNAFSQSAAAYRDVQPHTKARLILSVDDSASGVQYFARRENDSLQIAFRGSDSKKDWASNLTFWKRCIPYDNVASKVRVHTGFLSRYKTPACRERILRLITPEITRVQITGHSYGAALSVLCAVDVQYNFPDREVEVVLFGCPRVGNRAFQRSYNARVPQTLRVENGNDIVTKVPPALFGFHHVGAKVHLGFPRVPLLLSADAHRLEHYLSGLCPNYLP